MLETKHSELETLSYSLSSSAEWRREKAREFPMDAERNLAAAELLDQLSRDAHDLISGDLDRELTKAAANETVDWNDRRSEIIRSVGFHWQPSLAELVRCMIASPERERIEQVLRERFEEDLNDRIDQELEDTRDQREEALAEDIEERLRDEFEEGLDEAINDELDREEECA